MADRGLLIPLSVIGGGTEYTHIVDDLCIPPAALNALTFDISVVLRDTPTMIDD